MAAVPVWLLPYADGELRTAERKRVCLPKPLPQWLLGRCERQGLDPVRLDLPKRAAGRSPVLALASVLPGRTGDLRMLTAWNAEDPPRMTCF